MSKYVQFLLQVSLKKLIPRKHVIVKKLRKISDKNGYHTPLIPNLGTHLLSTDLDKYSIQMPYFLFTPCHLM